MHFRLLSNCYSQNLTLWTHLVSITPVLHNKGTDWTFTYLISFSWPLFSESNSLKVQSWNPPNMISSPPRIVRILFVKGKQTQRSCCFVVAFYEASYQSKTWWQHIGEFDCNLIVLLYSKARQASLEMCKNEYF